MINIPDKIRNLRRGLIAFALLFPALYLAFAVTAIVQNRQSTVEKVASDVGNVAATLNEHAIRTIGEGDSRLLGAIADIERRDLSIPGPDEFELHHLLKWHARQLPQSITIYVADAQGWIRAAGTTYPQRPLDIRVREYFRHHSMHNDPDLYISHPVKSRANGKWAITLSRRINHPDGSLKMIIGLAFDLEYFNRFYSTLRMGEHGRLLLVRRDGMVLMETPLTERVMQLNTASASLFSHLKQADKGVFETDRSAVDGTARIVGYASANQYPVIAVASVSRDHVLQPWRKLIAQIALIGMASLAMLFALTALLWRRLNDLMQTQDNLSQQDNALAQLEQRYQDLVENIDGIIWEAELPSYRFTYVSSKAAAISGYAAEEWLGDANFWHEKFMPQDEQKAAEAIQAFNSHAAVLQPIEHRLFKPDGEEVWLRSNISVATTAKDGIRLRGVSVALPRRS